MNDLPPPLSWPETRGACANAERQSLSDNEDVPLGWESALPVLQIECWFAEQAEARHEGC